MCEKSSIHLSESEPTCANETFFLGKWSQAILMWFGFEGFILPRKILDRTRYTRVVVIVTAIAGDPFSLGLFLLLWLISEHSKVSYNHSCHNQLLHTHAFIRGYKSVADTCCTTLKRPHLYLPWVAEWDSYNPAWTGWVNSSRIH